MPLNLGRIELQEQIGQEVRNSGVFWESRVGSRGGKRKRVLKL